MMLRALKPLRGYRPVAPEVQCSTRMERNPASPEHYFPYLKKKFAIRGFDMRFCGRSASVELNGSPLCIQHAGEVVLSMLLTGELVYKDGTSAIPADEPVEYADIGEIRITRKASVDALPKGQDAKQGLAGTEGSAVGEAETPNEPPHQTHSGK